MASTNNEEFRVDLGDEPPISNKTAYDSVDKSFIEELKKLQAEIERVESRREMLESAVERMELARKAFELNRAHISELKRPRNKQSWLTRVLRRMVTPVENIPATAQKSADSRNFKDGYAKELVLAASITSLLFALSILSSNYLARTNREFGTKILLFLTGAGTAASIHFLEKGRIRESDSPVFLTVPDSDNEIPSFGSESTPYGSRTYNGPVNLYVSADRDPEEAKSTTFGQLEALISSLQTYSNKEQHAKLSFLLPTTEIAQSEIAELLFCVMESGLNKVPLAKISSDSLTKIFERVSAEESIRIKKVGKQPGLENPEELTTNPKEGSNPSEVK